MRTNNFLAFIVVLAGITASVLILRTPVSNTTAKKTVVTSGTNETYVKNTIDEIKINPPTGQSSIPNETEEKNLTDMLASLYAAQFQKDNPRERLTETGISKADLPEYEALEELAKETEKEWKDYYIPALTIKDIIQGQNSIESEVYYLNEITVVTEKNLEPLNKNILETVDSWLNNQETADIDAYTRQVSNLITDLLAVKVPEKWLDFHISLVNLWQKKLTAITALKSASDDPLKAYLAFKEVPGLLNEGFALESKMEEQIAAF